jgi:hypothetical protein
MGLIIEMTDFIATVTIAIGVFIGALVAYKQILKAVDDELFLLIVGILGGMIAGGLGFLGMIALAIYVPIIFVSIIVVSFVIYKLEMVRRENKAVALAKKKADDDEKYNQRFKYVHH